MPQIANLIYFPDSRPGISRRRAGRGFSYRAPDGTRIEARAEIARLRALAVPPAYEDVWICPSPKGHLQATGRDVRARKQYRYHPDWTEFRSKAKYDQLAAFGDALPAIRRRLSRDLAGEAGDQAYAIAAVLALIDRLSVRIGHPDYATENRSYGATTLRHRHLKMKNGALTLAFTAKGGQKVRRTVKDRTLQKVLHRLDDLPGAALISWLDDDGQPRTVSSEQVNGWLADVTGTEGLTAKTFRTWNGSAAALEAATDAERITIKAMSEAAAERLHNTPTIARKSYIHPKVIALTEDPSPLEKTPPERTGLRLAERRLLALLTA